MCGYVSMSMLSNMSIYTFRFEYFLVGSILTMDIMRFEKFLLIFVSGNVVFRTHF